MVGNLLLRGMLVGVLAGLMSFGFARIFGEPQVDRAIAFEKQMGQARGELPEPQLVSRETQADEQLEPQGRKKLAIVQRRLRHADRCWSSPARRAIQTAKALQLDAIVEPMLRECDYGRWSGRSFDEVRAQEPEPMAEWLRDPEAAPYGGESIVSLIGRVAAWLETQNGMRGKTVAITHASVIRAAIVHTIEANPRSFWRIDVAPLSVTALSGNGGRWTLSTIAAAVLLFYDIMLFGIFEKADFIYFQF